MALYSFRDIETYSGTDDATHLSTTFGGTDLDATITGFRTLNVTGRELLAPDVKFTRRVAADGAWLDDVSYPVRAIVVEAMVTADDDDDLQQIFASLTEHLSGGVKKLSFSDESGVHFKAIWTGNVTPKQDNRNQVIELIFTCLDPYRYSDTVHTITNGKIPATVISEILPQEIEVTLASNVSQLKITNGRTGNNIVIDHSLVSGDKVKIRWDEPLTIMSNGGVSILNKLNILSDIENFKVKANDTISVVPSSASMIIKLQDRTL